MWKGWVLVFYTRCLLPKQKFETNKAESVNDNNVNNNKKKKKEKQITTGL